MGGSGGVGSGAGVVLGIQGGCERRIEVFGKIHKKKSGGGGGGWVGGGGREGGQVGVGLVGGQGGCERNVVGGVMWGMEVVNQE